MPSFAGPLIGGLFSALGARRQNRMARQMAREQMAFQERMSSTAYQRATKDLEAAGLNRILALGKPASSPAGAMAPVVDEIGPGVSSALAVRRQNQDIKNLRATERATDAQTRKTNVEADNARTQGLILSHGEAIGSLIGDLARIARGMTRGKSPKEVADWINGKIDQAIEALPGLGNSMGTTGWQLNKMRDRIIQEVLDIVQDEPDIQWLPPGEVEQRRLWRKETEGKDISFEQWKRERARRRVWPDTR